MQTKPNPSPEATELRRRAELRLKEQFRELQLNGNEADTQRFFHELQVHQVELEMQNEELQQSRDKVEAGLEKYSDLYDFAPVGYLTLDREGIIREANLTSASLLGIDRSRLLKRRFALRVSDDDLPVFRTFLAQVFKSKARESCEVMLIKEDKPPVAVQIEATIAASGQECRVVIEEITVRRQAEADRLILSKLESTGVLAGGIAHDFNNLLTVILLNLELAEALLPPGEELADRLEDAKKSTLLARGLAQQLITFAHGGAPIRTPTALHRLIQEAARASVSGSRVRCALSLAEDLWSAEVDAGQIGQVIRNLVLNAREAMPEGGTVSIGAENVVLEAHDNPSLPPGEYVQLSIADRGSGIAKDVLPKIFDPYFSTKQRGDRKGMGLGLTICHTVIQKHGGAIAVESEVGMGTTFSVYLPASGPLVEKPKSSVPTVLPQPGRILVMDDEEGVRHVIASTLRRLGCEVELVEDGQRAIEVFGAMKEQDRAFDVVILDLTVRGGMGGQEALQALLKIDPAVKAIVMSGYANDPVVQEHEQHGFKGALAKPFDIVKLQHALARVLEPGGDEEVTSDR